MHPLAFQLLTCVSLAAFGNDSVANIAYGILGNVGHDAFGKLPRRRLRAMGQPNHDLHKALAEAIADAANDLDLESIIRSETDSLRDLKGGSHLHIEEFLSRLQKSPAEALNIEAKNADLKTFLENPSTETFAPLAHLLGEQHLPGLSPELRETIIRKLFLRISERYWDRIKNTPAAWNAYSAEVFREFRKNLSDQSDSQQEILRKLDTLGGLDRLIVSPPPLSQLPGAKKAIDHLCADLRGDIALLSGKIDTLQTTADFTLRGVGEIKTDGKATARKILAIAALLLLLGIGGWFAHQSTRDKLKDISENLDRPLNKARLRAHLIEASEKALTADLAEAEAIVGDWQKRQKLTDGAQAAHQQRLSRVDELVNDFAAIESAEKATATSREMLRILDEEGIDAALEFLSSSSDRLIETSSRKAEEAHEILQPLLTGAQLAIANGEPEKAEALFLKLLAPEVVSWPEARHEYFVYLVDIKGPRQQSHGTLSAALAIYREAMRQATLLTLQEPESPQCQRDLSISHSKLSEIAVAKGDLRSALASITAALTITKKLALDSPEDMQWQQDLSIDHDRLGDIAMAQGDFTTAMTSYSAAMEVTKALASRDIENMQWQRNLANSHARFGDHSLLHGDLPAAHASYSAALEIAKKLATRDPENTEWQRDLSVIHSRLGKTEISQGDIAAAKASITAAFEIATKLAAKEPDNIILLRGLSMSHSDLGDISLEQGDLSTAKSSYTAALKIAEKLADRDAVNTDLLRDVSVFHGRLGEIAFTEGDLLAAKTSYTSGLEIEGKLAARDPENMVWQRDLFGSYTNLGNIAMAQNDPQAAKASYTAGLGIAEKLVGGSPENMQWQSDLAANYWRLGDINSAQGDLPAARVSYAASLKIAEKIASRDPEKAKWQRHIYTNHWRLADIAEKEGDTASARRYWQKCHDFLDGIVKAGNHVTTEDLEYLKFLKQKLGID